MAIIKCKMCGGDLNLMEGQSVAECEYCGSRQTVPAADNEKKLIQFERAERLRKNCEFDKAAGLYEAIVSEFRQEAEAYWGLVLCKYGIEYVDDPATGKKIPTCHRSSFDSIMEDPDFEQALENADSVARRVYREEAKQIEEIRKGIIAVSANEQPYDIFICYKETDENGERTLDSVLAQDIYDALREKGYRTFFARITLEDKLGVEYEPYIFAALNSAKIMLAVGTDYEYFNAVWVKNEWSRYLKLMAKDKSRHLIPCFKGIDAYDMPREFAKLQAQDLGKVGAMQDLLRGIEKILPRQKNTNVIQEKVVVGTVGGNNKVTALLERGNMALEDGDWAKADSFFEDVLNNDAKNAQAYIGKTLAQERCRTMDALVRKRRDVYQNVQSETLHIAEKAAHIRQMAQQYSLPGYVDEDRIRDLYVFERIYPSEVSGRQKQYREEENWWQNHKQLSRAEKFAVGAVAEHLQSEKKHLFSQLAERVKKAQEADARTVAKLEAAYDAHIAEADKKAEKIYNDGLARREQNYQKWLEQAKKETDPKLLNALASCFTDLGDYKDSKNLAEHCRKRTADEQAKIDAEKERQRILKEKAEKERKAKNKKIAIISSIAAVIVIAVIVVMNNVVIPANNYKKAEAMLAAGQYEAAADAFTQIESYKDSASKAEYCKTMHLDGLYAQALAEKEAGHYQEAISQFEELNGYRDSNAQIQNCEDLIQERINEGIYQKAMELLDSKSYQGAIEEFRRIPGYKDSEEKIAAAEQAIADIANEQLYKEAEALLSSGKTAEAAIAFGKIADYKDAFTRSLELRDPYFRNTLTVASWYVVGIKNDGTIVSVGPDSTYSDYKTLAPKLADWNNVIDLQGNQGGTIIGLRADGTVYTTKEKYAEVRTWTNIVQIVLGYEEVIGLKADGTLVSCGDNDYSIRTIDKDADIIEIHKSGNGLYGVTAAGKTIKTYGAKGTSKIDNLSWDNLRAVDTIVLRDDGTIASSVYLDGKRQDFSNWKNVVAIACDHSYALGVKEDGTVLKAGTLDCNISGWRNISRIYYLDSYTTDNLMARTTNGTVLVATEKSGFLKFDCSVLSDIRVPAN